MNKKLYRLVFNKIRGILMAVAEAAKSTNKSASSGTTASSGQRICRLLWLAGAGILISPFAASYASCLLPQGGNFGAGSGSVGVASGKNMAITQNTQNAVVNFQCFGIGNGYGVTVNQPNSQARALFRDLGSDPSVISGSLSANGEIFILNPMGVLFGPNARIDVAGLLASTRAISDADFMNGRLNFVRDGKDKLATVENQGILTAGWITLVADKIVNSGTLKGNTVALAAGDTATLALNNGVLVDIKLSASSAKALIANNGILEASERIYLLARGRNDVLDSAINLGGLLSAPTITVDGGNHGVVNISQATLNADNTAGKGGTITVTGENIGLFNSYLSANGANGGGTVLIGGDWQGGGSLPHAKAVVMSADSSIDASALTTGNGGKVVLWSSDFTSFDGRITARGDQGGQIETSSSGGLGFLNVQGRVYASGAQGHAGLWLLDPSNVNISAALSTAVNTSNVWSGNILGTNVNVNNASIEATLNGGTNVTVTTNVGLLGATGNIGVNANINKTAGGNATLSLIADNNLTFASGVNITSTSNALNLQMSTNNGVLALNNNSIVTNGGNITATATTSVNDTAAVLRIENSSINVGSGLAAFNSTYIGSGSNVNYVVGLYVNNANFNGNTNLSGVVSPSSNYLAQGGAGIWVNGNLTINNGTLNASGTLNGFGNASTPAGIFLRPSNLNGGGSMNFVGQATSNNSGIDTGVLAVATSILNNVTGGIKLTGSSTSGIGVSQQLVINNLKATGNLTIDGTTGSGATAVLLGQSGGNSSVNVISHGGDILVTEAIQVNSSTSRIYLNSSANINLNFTGFSSLQATSGSITLIAGSGSGDASGGNVTITHLDGVLNARTINIYTGTYDAVGTSTYRALTKLFISSPSAAQTEKWYGATLSNLSQASTGKLNVFYRAKPVLGVTGTGVNRAYDGTNQVTVNYNYTGVVDGDILPGAGIGTVASPHAGSYNTITVPNNSTFTSTGNAQIVHGYDTTNTTISPVTITPKAATITLADVSKVYDGTNSVTANWNINGFLTGENVTGLTAAYNTAHAGTGLTVAKTNNASGISGGTAGSLVSDYAITYVSSTNSTITPKALTGTFNPATKVYDGGTAAGGPVAGSGVTGWVSGDTGGIFDGNGSYNNAHVLNASQVTYTNVALNSVNGNVGSLASDYTWSGINTTVAGSVTPRAVTINPVSDQRKYDTTTNSSVQPDVAGLIAGDQLQGARQVFDNKNAGARTLSLVNGSANSIAGGSGSDLSDYQVTYNQSTVAGQIDPALLQVTGINTQDKVKDGTTGAQLSGTPHISGVLASDQVGIDGAPQGTYANSGPGVNIPVYISGLNLNGPDATNYALDPASLLLYASITSSSIGLSSFDFPDLNRILPPPPALFINAHIEAVQSVSQPENHLSGLNLSDPLVPPEPLNPGMLTRGIPTPNLERTTSLAKCVAVGGINLGQFSKLASPCNGGDNKETLDHVPHGHISLLRINKN